MTGGIKNLAVADVKPKNNQAIFTKSRNSQVLENKARNYLVLQPTAVYQDTVFLNGMSMGPGWYMYVTFNGNRF